MCESDAKITMLKQGYVTFAEQRQQDAGEFNSPLSGEGYCTILMGGRHYLKENNLQHNTGTEMKHVFK